MENVMFLGFNLYAWITIITVLGMFSIMLFTKLRSDLVFLGAIGILYVTGVLDAKEAFSGFSSSSVITVGVLFVVIAGLTQTGVLHWIVKNLLGTPNSYSKAVTRTWYFSFQTADSPELRFRYGWCLYPYRYPAKPDYQRTLRSAYRRGHEHPDDHYPWFVLSHYRCVVDYRHAALAA